MIGINSQILSPAGGSVGVGFAIPVSTAKRVIPQLLQYGEVRRPKLGASLISAADIVSRGYRLPVEKGLVLQRVDPGTTAANAGLRGLTQSATGGIALGDIIISIDGEPMNDLDDLYRLLDKKQIGETVQVELYRNGANVKLPVKLLGTAAEPGRCGGRNNTQLSMWRADRRARHFNQ